MDDKAKKKTSKLRLNLRKQLAAAALMMTSSMGLRQSDREERDYVKREPLFRESASGSGDFPEFINSNNYDYVLSLEETAPDYFLNSAHAEKTEDGVEITVFDAAGKETKYI